MPGGQFLLGYAEYAEAVMRSLGLKGDLPREIQTSFGLGVQLLNLEAPEFLYLKRSVLWESGGTVSAVAAENGIFALGGRAGSSSREVLAIVDKIIITNIAAAAQTFAVGVDWFSLATFPAGLNRTSYPRDDRAALVSSSAFATGTDTTAGALMGSSHTIVTLQTNERIQIDGPWVLSNKPNAAGLASVFACEGSVVNQGFRAAVFWTERQLHDTET